DAKAQLLAIAAERTGYPEDMLGLDMDLEADLGIDSIKRVEILAAYRKSQPEAVSAQLQPHMEKVAKAKTLQEVLDRLAEAMAAPAGSTPAAAETARPFDLTGSVPSAVLARYVMRAEAESLPAGQPTKVKPGIYVVVPDTLGVAAALATLIARDGGDVHMPPDGLASDEAALAAWLERVRAGGRIRGLVGLAAILPPDPMPRDIAAWHAGMDTCVKSLFPLLRGMAPDLQQGGRVLVASAMGGRFSRDGLGADRAALFPGAGGGVGLIKTLAMEWEHCRCKAVDLDPAETAAALAAHLHAELAADAGRREVGYPAGTRTIFRTTLAPLERAATREMRPDKDWVVVAVGGARGITAETLRPFAAAGATCVLVARAALPGPEDAATAAHDDAAKLRRYFLKEAAAAGTRPTPAKIEARVQAVLRDREIRANVTDLQALGGTLDARLCDVRDEVQVAALLDTLYARYGRIDAVLLGAGLIEDRLITDKTRDSLDRVFDTKVDGAYFFARHLRPESLRFLALFSSVAGRYGNRGQGDYAAANEVLNRYAWQLQARFGPRTKVVSVNWGAWARTTNGHGMLTPETARQFRERGLELIEPEPGGRFLIDELLYALPGDVEVVAGKHDWDAYEDAAGRPTPAARQVA
ncbi:MAG: SDR family oxidoreductase, partial [Beijerinckiaceae bacterium]|nr:SDR family oxidoreductase [Beijerinckiaceae bacterium]